MWAKGKGQRPEARQTYEEGRAKEREKGEGR